MAIRKKPKSTPKKKAATKKASPAKKKAPARKVARGASKKPTRKSPAAAAKLRPEKSPEPRRPAGVPEGYQSATPYLTVRGGVAALSFYEKAFGAKTIGQLMLPGRKVAHAEIQIGNSRIMLADEMPEFGNQSPQALGGTPTGLSLYVPDCDAVVARAVAAGARVERPVADQFYGDRSGTVVDPFGHRWTLATRKENLAFPEMQKRMEAMFSAP